MDSLIKIDAAEQTDVFFYILSINFCQNLAPLLPTIRDAQYRIFSADSDTR